MNISPINFTGVTLSYNTVKKIPKKKDEKKPTGFCQVVNFLNKDEFHDFEIKKPHNKSAQVCVYDKETGIQKTTIKVPLKNFATKPAEVIGKIGQAIYSGKEMGKNYWIHLFETSDKSDDTSILEQKRVCNDFVNKKSLTR